MSNIEQFAALVASFRAGEISNFVKDSTCQIQTPMEALFGLKATSVSVSSIQCLHGTFCGVAVDNGIGAASRFVAAVVKYGVDKAPTIVWRSGCRSLSQAKSEAEDACRSFAANDAYTG